MSVFLKKANTVVIKKKKSVCSDSAKSMTSKRAGVMVRNQGYQTPECTLIPEPVAAPLRDSSLSFSL